MPKAYLAIHTAAGMSPEVRATLESIDAVTDAHVVAGNYDLIVELDAPTTGDLLPIVTREIQGLEGVGATRTYVVLE